MSNETYVPTTNRYGYTTTMDDYDEENYDDDNEEENYNYHYDYDGHLLEQADNSDNDSENQEDDDDDEETYERLYPLHHAIWSNEPLSEIDDIIEKNPSVLQLKDDKGYNVLHVACDCYEEEDDDDGEDKEEDNEQDNDEDIEMNEDSVIAYLVHMYPMGLQEATAPNEVTPLHIACSKQRPFILIKLLVTTYPNAVQQPSKDGWYPLHKACRVPSCETNERIIQYLVKQYPMASQMKESNTERYPLHIACEYNRSITVIQLLLNVYPKAVEERDKNGHYPLQIACRHQQPVEVVQLLFEYYPAVAIETIRPNGWNLLHLSCAMKQQSESVLLYWIAKFPLWKQSKDCKGRYPLHIACAVPVQSVSMIQLLLQEYPLATQHKDVRRMFPLQIACQQNQSDSVLQLLINAYPLAVQQKMKIDGGDGTVGNLLHWACTKRRSESLIKLLIDTYAIAVQKINNRGQYPLHLACSYRQPESVITLLLSTYPLAVEKRMYNIDGTNNNRRNSCYLLHWACRERKSESLINLLLETYPMAIQKKDAAGRYPVHIVCLYYKQSESLIKLLIAKYPLAVQEPMMYRTSGYLLLHWACQERQSQEIIELLINYYPMAVQEKDGTGQYPLNLACRYQQSESVISLLLKQYPLAAQQCDAGNRKYPLHWVCHHNDQSMSLIQMLLDANPNAVQENDSEGNTPLRLALFSNQSRTIIQKLVRAYPRLDYDYKDYPNSTFDDTVGILQMLLSDTELQTLNIRYNHRYHDPYVLMLVVDAIRTAMEQNQTLQTLAFLPVNRWMIRNQCMPILSGVLRYNCPIKDFHVGLENVGGMMALANVLTTNASLCALTIACYEFNQAGLVSIFLNLQDNESLQRLKVIFNQADFDQDSVDQIIQALQYNDTLKYVEIDGVIGNIDIRTLIQKNRSSGQLAPKGKARKRYDTYGWLLNNTRV